MIPCHEPRRHLAGLHAGHCYVGDTTLIPLRRQGDTALAREATPFTWVMLGGGRVGVYAWACLITQCLMLNHCCKFYPIKQVTITSSKNYFNPRRLITSSWEDNGAWWYQAQMENWFPHIHKDWNQAAGNPFNGLITELSPSADSITKSPHSTQGNSESSA